jgi:CubicO group peptidase (beta-lactamase class C family)
MRLFTILALILCTANVAFASYDEAVIRKDLSANELSAYVEQLTSNGQIIVDLNVRVVERRTVFDVASQVNEDKRPWLIQVNISDKVFRASSKRYKSDGFKNTVDRIIPNGRDKLHSTVWVQKVETAASLKLPNGPPPVNGEHGRDLIPLNDLLTKTLTDNNIPGATVAVARDGEIVYERGFGYSDVDKKSPMNADSVMRIASISKPITAIAVLLLMEDGKLKLDDLAIDYLTRDKKFALPKDADAAWSRITIQHLLQHSGGWDREKSKDPMFELLEITRALDLKKTASIPDVIKYQLSRPMDFEPGSSHAYSNFGYCLLGRVIEVASGQSYEKFVTERILKPCGMTQTRLGKTRFSDQADDEAIYYTQKAKMYPAIWDVAPGNKSGKFESVAGPYGHWDLEVFDSHGGWTSTAADLVRFAVAVDSKTKPLIRPESLTLLKSRPSFTDSDDKTWYGFGWSVRSVSGIDVVNLWHSGLIAGTSTILVKRSDNLTWAVLFNVNDSKDGQTCSTLIDRPMHAAVDHSIPLLPIGELQQEAP